MGVNEDAFRLKIGVGQKVAKPNKNGQKSREGHWTCYSQQPKSLLLKQFDPRPVHKDEHRELSIRTQRC